MNWLINIIIIQLLLGQTLSDLSCLKGKNCSCLKHAEKEEVEVTCNSSTITANLIESLIVVDCKSNQLQWEKSFNHINVTKLSYNHCMLDIGINQTMSILGIDEIKSIILFNVKLNGSLESFYFSNLNNVNQLHIRNTKLTLTNESFDGTLALTELYLRGNSIEEIPRNIFKHLKFLEILDLGGNKITEIDTDLFNGVPLKGLLLDSNYLKTLSLNVPSLKRLDVSNNGLMSLTVDNLNKLVELSLNKNILLTMTNQPFKNTSLEMIRYNNGNLSTVPDKFLTKLDRLRMVFLKNLNLEMVPQNMIWNSANITELSLASNHLKELPVLFFRDSKLMKKLDLSKNKIEKIDLELMKPLINLENLDLSDNLIFQINKYGLRLGSFLGNLIKLNLEKNNIMYIEQEALNVPKLKYLKLAHNNISTLFSNYSFSLINLDAIEEIDLSHNKISNIDQGWLGLIKLKTVNLAYNKFTVLGTEDFQFFNDGVNSNFNFNPLQAIDLSNLVMFVKAQLLLGNEWNIKTRQITVSGNKLICDCHNYEFARYLHNQMPRNVYKYIKIEQNMICNNGTEFANINMNTLTCDWNYFVDLDKIHCPGCVCSYRPHDKSAIMNCSNRNLTFAPDIIISSKNINYTELNLRNNFITKLPDYGHLNIRKLNVGYNNLITINITQLPKNLIVSIYN